VNETRGIRGLEMTRRPAEKRRTREADIPIPSARSMICSFWCDVSLVVSPIQAGSRAGAVGCACWSRTAWTLSRSVLDISDSLNGFSPAGKSDTRSKYEYRDIWRSHSRAEIIVTRAMTLCRLQNMFTWELIQQVPPKCLCFYTKLHGVTSKKIHFRRSFRVNPVNTGFTLKNSARCHTVPRDSHSTHDDLSTLH